MRILLCSFVAVVCVSGSAPVAPLAPADPLDCQAALGLLHLKGTRGQSLTELGASCNLTVPLLAVVSSEISPGRIRALSLGECSDPTVKIVSQEFGKPGELGMLVMLRRSNDGVLELRGSVGELNPPNGTGSLALCGTVSLRVRKEQGHWVLVDQEVAPDGANARRRPP